MRYYGRSRLQKMCRMSNNSEIPPWTYNLNECLSERRILSIASDSRRQSTACSNRTSRFPDEMHGPQTLSIGRLRRSSRVEAHHLAIFKSGLRLLWPGTHLFTIGAWDSRRVYSFAPTLGAFRLGGKGFVVLANCEGDFFFLSSQKVDRMKVGITTWFSYVCVCKPDVPPKGRKLMSQTAKIIFGRLILIILTSVTII